MALVVQKTGSRQGQAAPVLYTLAANENVGSCNASNTSGLPAGNCIFNDVTIGNNAVPGETGYGSAGAAYQAGVGYDLATGLGSVNVTNLVNGFAGAPIIATGYHVTIEQPGSQNSTFIGLSTFSGWAVDDAAAIATVQASIDGVPYGMTTYGSSRPDICAVYPGRAGCPNVGWSIAVDTTLVADGTHTLDITATSTLGDHFTVSSSFTVANWSTADPMMVDIDTPNSKSSPFSGMVGFGGWALDNTGAISSVSISVDGTPYGNARYGGNRADACAAFPGRAGCPNVGWDFTLDTTALADGTHTLAVTGFTVTGQNTTVTAGFKTSNLSGSPIMISIDKPSAQTGPVSGGASFGGWALDNNTTVSSVAVSIDGIPYGNARYGGPRSDVCTVFPGRAGCPNVGWDFLLDTAAIANGTHTVEVMATAQTGQRATASGSFIVANPTAGTPLKMNIDQPNGQNATLTGLISVGGWAIDDNGPISSIVISIDGAPRGTLTTTPVSRPDVCAVFPGRAGCPYVGWNFALDTTLIADGSHTLAVTGTSTTGDQLTLSTSITVANWTAGNPLKISIDKPNSQSTAFSGVVAFGGWALSDIAAITNVAISIDGVAFGNAIYGANRGDVCAVFPGRAGCPNVGWNFYFDTTLVANGTHTLDVTVTSSGGQSTTATATFNVSNSNAVAISIDRPGGQSTVFSGVAAFGGWALDTAGGVGVVSVQILIDGVFYGNASYGKSRPDVCAVPTFAQALGCPAVGWDFTLDTTLLANGLHTVQARALAATGQQGTVSTSFRVDNLL